MASPMRIRPFLLIAAACAPFLLGSCSVLSRVIVFNNTAGTAGFAVHDEKLRAIAPGTERWVHSYWRCVEDYCSREITVERDGYRYSYAYGGTPDELDRFREYSVRKWHPARNEIRMQINSDGALYILMPDQAFPLSATEAQPFGFPLYPIDRIPIRDEA